jgi:hypothetical protein
MVAEGAIFQEVVLEPATRFPGTILLGSWVNKRIGTFPV